MSKSFEEINNDEGDGIEQQDPRIGETQGVLEGGDQPDDEDRNQDHNRFGGERPGEATEEHQRAEDAEAHRVVHHRRALDL